MVLHDTKENQQIILAFISAAFVIVETCPLTATANFAPKPLYKRTASYKTAIPNTNGKLDETDIYYPILSDTSSKALPVALLLQGALVDKSDYSNYASIIASYGFIVIVPNRLRSIGESKQKRLLAETSQIDNVLNFVNGQKSHPTSPISSILDTDKLVLLGHSFGGAVGLSAIGDLCQPKLCKDEFTRPEELVAGVFFGTNLRDRSSGNFIPIDNDGIPIALIQGDLDGVALPERAFQTYQSIQNSPKALITIKGTNHYGITNGDSQRDLLRPNLDQKIATETIALWSALFLRGTILNDEAAYDYVLHTGDAVDRNVTVLTLPRLKASGILGSQSLRSVIITRFAVVSMTAHKYAELS